MCQMMLNESSVIFSKAPKQIRYLAPIASVIRERCLIHSRMFEHPASFCCLDIFEISGPFCPNSSSIKWNRTSIPKWDIMCLKKPRTFVMYLVTMLVGAL